MFQTFTKALIAFVLLGMSIAVKAQTNIASYQFSRSLGNTYTPLTGDVTLFSTWDSEVSSAIPLGGTFTYGGVAFTTCYVSANGAVTFGAGSSSSTPLSGTAASGAIAAYAQDGANSTVAGSTPKISYATVGNEFVVQYQDHANYYNRSSDRMNFQIRLNLSTNVINIAYGSCSLVGTSTTAGVAQVGLRGSTNTWTTNVNNLLLPNIPAGTSCTWADAVTGNANTSTLIYTSGTNPNITIPNGLTYTWTPATTPAPVRTFNAVSNITTNSATVSWAPAITSPGAYNVQYRALGSCTWTNLGSNPVVGDTTVNLTGLAASTVYQIRVQSVASGSVSIWSHIPSGTAGTGINGYTAAGTFATTASCSVPTSITVGSITTSSASVIFTSTGNSFVAEYGLAGFTPGTGATAGTGGTIVTGSGSPITLSGLTSGSTYDVYVRQNCSSSGNGYSTNSTKATFSTSCVAVTSFSENFDALTAPALPACFRKIGIAGSASTQTTTPSSSPNTLYIYSSSTTASAQAVVALPPVSNAGAGTNQLRFKMRANFTAGDTLQVGYLTNVADSSTFIVITQIRAAALTYAEYTVLPGTTPGSNQYLAFRAKGTAGASMLIDDIYWETIPACPTPTSVSISTVTANSASVNFTSAGSSFIVEYGATGFTPGTGATAGTGGTIVTGAASPISITGLTSSTTYQVYVRQNCTTAGNGYSTNASVVSFTTLAVAPVNDDATGAITLTVGAACTGAAYTNAAATLGTGEPYPSCSGTANTPVWFKFVAPASGSVRVSTDVGTGNTFSDSKIGLFSTSDPANYSTFSIIACDEDGGSVLGSGFMAVLYATGLTSGTTYYIAVDKYGSTATTTASGTFCITVSDVDTSMLSRTNSCTSTYQAPVGSVATYTGWVPLLDASSRLIALVQNPAGGSVSSYVVRQNVNTGTLRQSEGTFYLDRNFRITNSTATNVNTQLFFLQAELSALQSASPLTTLSNLGVTRQTETVAGCYNDFDASKGPINFIAQSGSGSANGISWINFMTPSFSNFYLHRNGTALPIKFEYLTGKKTGSTNTLNWKVTCTSTSITMVLERSADARTFNHNVTTISATQARCGQPFDAVDAMPLNGISYYRLKMIDVDGKVSYSPVAAVLNGKAGAELVGIYPTVVANQAYLSVTSSRNITMQFSISDMSGKVITTINQAVSSGSSMLPVNTSNLASGVYNITGLLEGVRTQTLRFVKQ